MQKSDAGIREMTQSAAERAFALSGRAAQYALWIRKAGYLQIGDLFARAGEYTREHGAMLVELSSGCQIPSVDALLADMVQRLHECPYERFAQTAAHADLPQTAELFRGLGQIESTQCRCFSMLLENIRSGSAFEKTTENYWICRVCGALYRGVRAPQVCPVCAMPREGFSLYAENY